jgi:hypothetical protein
VESTKGTAICTWTQKVTLTKASLVPRSNHQRGIRETVNEARQKRCYANMDSTGTGMAAYPGATNTGKAMMQGVVDRVSGDLASWSIRSKFVELEEGE